LGGLTSENHTCFKSLLLWAQLAAAHWRGNAFCLKEHRASLLRSGEPEYRLDEIALWRLSDLFTEEERAVIALSEAISEGAQPDQLEPVLREAKRVLGSEEIHKLSSAVLAVNEWIDLHSGKPVRVIVVEDNPDDQELLGRQLRKTVIGDHVLFLSEPKTALQLLGGPTAVALRQSLVALILDIHLPHMTGIELLRRIRAMEQWEQFPVIMMSTDKCSENVSACSDLNVMAFIEKPLTVASFAQAVAPLFHRSVQN
jgi:CheY-like chemotaxis protein